MSSVYGMAAVWRRRWYGGDRARQRWLRQPVVSIGNLSAGGTGKTPIVAHLAQLLLDQGERPAILSRGYGRRRPQDGVTVVSNGSAVLADLASAGDEPLMLARALPGIPVLVSASRYLSGRLAEAKLGASVHLLDDGFQHLELGRDVDLLVIDERDLNDRLLPAGRLREPLTMAAGADAALVNAADDSGAGRIGRALGLSTCFRVERKLGMPCLIAGAGVVATADRVLAVAGIAHPERFFADLAAAGWNVVGTSTFPDHHQFTSRDVERLTAAARAADAIIMTTEKDAVRLAAHELGTLVVAVVPLTVSIEPAPLFAAWLRRRLQAARRPPRLPAVGSAPGPDARRPALETRSPEPHLAVRALIAVLRVVPDRLVRVSGSVLGLAFHTFDRAHRRIAERNLAAAFPLWPAAARRAIGRRAFAHFGRLLFELLKFSTLSPEAMLARVEFEGEERARLAYSQKKGVLFFTGHFGFWELHAIAHALKLEPIGVLARALDNPRLNVALERIRQQTGNTVIYRQGTIRRVMRMLHAGQGVALLIDQHIQSRDAVYVDFFNRPAATTSALAALALRTGAPVVPVFALPLGPGRYRVIYEHPVEPPPADSAQAVREFTQRCTDVLEMHVRRNPELWLWMHRRWRDSGPSLEGVPGMFPAAETD
jgi:tetraacyldisaccharide 4'-kinase